MIVNSFLDIDFSINDFELLNSNSASNFCFVLTEDIFTGFPVCRVEFSSSYDFINDHPIIDGSLMTINIENKIYNTKETLKFRVSSVTLKTTDFFCNFLIDGYIDFYEYFRSPNKYAAYGLSSEVFKNIAKINDLESDIDDTNDKQLWIPSEVNVGSFMNIIANHGWCSMDSCMVWFIDRLKKLSYKNISDLFYNTKDPKKFHYGDIGLEDPKNDVYKYKNVIYNINTGLENIKNNGYGGKNHHFDLLSYGRVTNNANKVRAVTEIVNVNKELSQGVPENTLEFDVGNFHQFYYLAENQNRRIRSLMSTYAILSCEQLMPVRLGEIVTLDATSSGNENSQAKTLNCSYIVSSLKTTITAISVSMEVILCTSGYNGVSKESY